jgi:hypothetical protein
MRRIALGDFHFCKAHSRRIEPRFSEGDGLELSSRSELRQAARQGTVASKEGFWFSTQRQLKKPRSRRDAAVSLRKQDKIAPQEYQLAIGAAPGESFSAERADLTALVGRVVGFDRTGNGLESSISGEIDRLLRTGEILESGGRLEIRQLGAPKQHPSF